MINNAIHLLKKYLKFSDDLYARQSKRAAELSGYEDFLLHLVGSSGVHSYYSVKRKGDKGFKYLGGESHPEVKKIKEAHYLKVSLPRLKKNNQLIRDFLGGYRSIGFNAINQLLPALYENSQPLEIVSDNEKAARWKKQSEAYKDTFEVLYPDELKIETCDGTMVRSKSEALIYNLLRSLGITFVYELPLKLGNTTLRPDFTILSEIDYETVIILEHFGMMSVESYRNKNFKKMMTYLNNKYTPGVEVFFTFETGDGGLRMSPVYDIIDLKIRPNRRNTA